MDKVSIIKIGGNVIDDAEKLKAFLQAFAQLQGKKILVHGGGKLATDMAGRLNIPQQMIDGRRVTDEETLKLVTMVYAGYINKNIVAQLQAFNCRAVGITGADGNAVLAHKRVKSGIDWGFAGDVDAVNADFLGYLLNGNYTVVLAPISHDGKGGLLNTNADTIAQETARALSAFYQTTLIYCFEKAGVLLDANNDQSVIGKITPAYYTELKLKNLVFAGMIPKLDNAFAALASGVHKVIIGKAEALAQLTTGVAGTTIAHE